MVKKVSLFCKRIGDDYKQISLDIQDGDTPIDSYHTYMKLLALLNLSAFLFASTVASAQIISYDGSTAEARTDGPYTIGNLFQVGATALTINSLGVQDAGGDSFGNASVDVGIWDTSGALLASTTVTSADALGAGDYRYASISDLTLAAGDEYRIGAFVGTGSVPFLDGGSNITGPFSSGNSDITLVEADFDASGSFADPTSSSDNSSLERWGPANALVAAVPEPGTWAMLLVGGCLLLGVQRWRRA
jgi:hypothetical protein